MFDLIIDYFPFHSIICAYLADIVELSELITLQADTIKAMTYQRLLICRSQMCSESDQSLV